MGLNSAIIISVPLKIFHVLARLHLRVVGCVFIHQVNNLLSYFEVGVVLGTDDSAVNKQYSHSHEPYILIEKYRQINKK